MVTLNCAYCNKEYKIYPSLLKGGKKHYCSDLCRQLGSKGRVSKLSQKITVKCAYCGKEKKVSPSVFKSKKNHYCNRECQGLYRSKNYSGENSPTYKGGITFIDAVCEECGKNYKAKRCNHERSNHHYCSRKCKTISESRIPKPNKLVTVICDVCSKEYKRKLSQYVKYKLHFCSSKCREEDHIINKRSTLENNGNWLGGKSYEPYPPVWGEELKNAVRERDNNTCQICNNPGKEVHHIDYNKENCDMNNLITLCQSDHSKTNFDRDQWQEILSKKMEERRVA